MNKDVITSVISTLCSFFVYQLRMRICWNAGYYKSAYDPVFDKKKPDRINHPARYWWLGYI